MYLLDTNHCSRIIEGDAAVIARFSPHRQVRATTCVIVQAELLFMAYYSRRADVNLLPIRAFLSRIRIHSIDDETTDLCAQIKTAIFQRWAPKERSKRRHFRLNDLGLTDNDLWIAAIALRNDLIVVTSDGDFARIAQVTDLRHESWLGSEQ
ncbi:MAG: type II toxin-antitoxin system VapC family toxin [Thermomicrobiales bacterium]